jgi:lysophospholipase L1-like esterase
MRVLVFGDSITQGYWDTKGGWVDRLREYYDKLQVQDLQRRDEPTIFNLGISADNSENVLSRIVGETKTRIRHHNLPIVILQIGTNDCSLDDGTAQVALAAYRQNLATILEKIQPLSSKLIFVGLAACDEAKTTPVCWGEHYYRNGDIKTYEDAMAEIARTHSIPFVPVFDYFMAALKEGKDLLSDGLHPNDAGHEVILEIVKPKLTQELV